MTEREKKSWLEKINRQSHAATPYMIVDLSIVEKNARQIKELLGSVEIYFAVKSNSDPRIISKIDTVVDGYDIASLGEWKLLKSQNISPGRVLFSNPVKVPSHITKTREDNIRYYAVDSVDEIKKMSILAPGANVYLRVQVSDYGSKFPLSKKYGLSPTHVAEYASLSQSMGLKVRGLAFHVGSQSENLHVWKSAIEISGRLISRLRSIGMNIDLLNIGGGFPADYGQPSPSIIATCRVINKAIKRHIPQDVQIVAEPGRFIVANSSVMVSEIIAREHRAGTDWLHLDLGVFQGLIEPLEMNNWKYPVFTDRRNRGYKQEFVLTGPTCDAYDTIGTDYSLPADMNMGDRLYIGSTGAYTTVYGSNFNGFEMPKVYFIE